MNSPHRAVHAAREPNHRPRWADLHMHSTASDGGYAPAKLMSMAAARRLAAVALTDHDTIDGLTEAAQAATTHGMEFVPGIELEARQGRRIVHILGYFIDATSPALLRALADERQRRDQRNREIVARLAALGIRLDYDALVNANGGRPLGRPHLANELVSLGIVSSFRQAFARYLGSSAATYVPHVVREANEAIAMIRAAGDVASLAHPSRVGCETSLELENVVRRLGEAGLAALEVSHPDVTGEFARTCERLARKLDLAPTGGSDFHRFVGAERSGTGFYGHRVPCEWIASLRERRAG